MNFYTLDTTEEERSGYYVTIIKKGRGREVARIESEVGM